MAGLDLAQSTVSQHLKILVDAGLVHYEQSGQSSRYSINPAAFANVAALASDIASLCCPPETIIGETQSLPDLQIAFKD